MAVIERTFTANIEVVPDMVGFVAAQAEAAGLHPKRVMHLEVATEETVVNICHYAYKIPPGEVRIRITSEGTAIQVEFIDSGVPFDPLDTPAPDLQADLDSRNLGGLGIFLIRRFLDEVHYSRQDGYNILRLVIKNEGA